MVENAPDVLQIFNTTLVSLEVDRTGDIEDPDLRILGLLEDQELKTLAWGLVDGGFADDELLDLLEDAATAVGDDRSEEEIKQQLESRVLITKVASPAGSVWRTRMAETVRLLARLRQLFPPHMNNG